MEETGGLNEAATENFDIALTFAQGMLEKAIAFLPSVVGAFVVLIVGLWIAGRMKSLVQKGLSKSGKIDQTLSGFLSSLVHYGLIALVVITTLGVFGVPTTSFAAIIGAAAIAAPLAVPAEMLSRDLWCMIGASLALVPIVLLRVRIGRRIGCAFLALYIAYIYFALAA